jgi:hypothetical protein
MVDVYSGTLTLTPNAADSIEASATGTSWYVPSGGKAYIGTNGAGAWYVRQIRTVQSAISPGGYLTLVSGQTVMINDVTAATTLYYTPDTSGLVPIYAGSAWIGFPFSELSCALNATQQAIGTAHDVFVINVSGSPTLVIGPAWRNPGAATGVITGVSNATPIVVTATNTLVNGDIVYLAGVKGNTAANGAWTVSAASGTGFTLTGSVGNGAYTSGTGTFSSRGNGSGTTQLARQNGLYTNAVQMTAYNGATPYTVSAGQGTYVGSILIDATAGQLTCTKSWGQSRKWGVWNAYNRKNITMLFGDSTASWVNSGGAWGPANATTVNGCTAFLGLPEEIVRATQTQYSNTATGAVASNAIGIASSTSPTGVESKHWVTSSVSDDYVGTSEAYAALTIGAISITALEFSSGGTFYGTQINMQGAASYRG